MNQTPVSLNFSAHGTAAGTPWRAVAGRSRVAVICASWHTDVVHQARDSLASELQAQGVAAQNISHFNVPGAFEIPLLAKKLAASGRFDAIIACALVVNGGIYRHEFVSSAVIDGLMRVQLDSEIPVFSAVLTPRDFHEHGDHVEFFRAHFVKKGVEVAHACLAALDQLSQVQALGHARAA
ncbi:6,7-dimethyl-8-ribityllumazine synthase [Delftia sp. PS-11]|uniref:6,7-dimethyl-8-ribityllumazine synthase n=1 Tax=Delftia sp. PS-11 TaxID=2767222 RepID=UPI002457D2D6|nr:6,7-dimethyl-8-ribityllumazine synthase [Delftia sp. PS-11]KAJ8745291.1 6,7-dimethyl-8-ribityllumazine synthase [Delftia sp. PS-11]